MLRLQSAKKITFILIITSNVSCNSKFLIKLWNPLFENIWLFWFSLFCVFGVDFTLYFFENNLDWQQTPTYFFIWKYYCSTFNLNVASWIRYSIRCFFEILQDEIFWFSLVWLVYRDIKSYVIYLVPELCRTRHQRL